MPILRMTAFVVSLSVWSGSTLADPRCQPFTAAEQLPLLHLDRADPVENRVTGTIEQDLLAAQISGETMAPLSKLYCRVGMFEMAVRFVQPVEDDAVAGIVTEATYSWVPEADPPGWQLSKLERQQLCARGSEPFAQICP